MNEDALEPSLATSLTENFQEGGAAMLPLSALGCLLPLAALVLLVVGIASKKNRALRLGVGLLLAALLPPAIGLAAAALGRSQAEDAIAAADPEDAVMIRMAAEGDALMLNATAASGALCPGFVGCVLIGIGLARRPRFG
jgi:hypothetical protein